MHLLRASGAIFRNGSQEDSKMQEKGKKGLVAGICLVLLFVLWTVLVLKVDVRPAGEAGTEVGFAAVNTRFHEMTGVNMKLYDITEWLGYIPFLICAGFGLLGLMQLVRGKSLKKVDADIILLGVYYIAVICCYFLFEKLHINDRPVLMDGKAEASYPSSHTLLAVSVMPTLIFQVNRRCGSAALRKAVFAGSALFAAFLVIARLVCGVHWLTDIIGGVLLGAGLYLVYRSAVAVLDGGKAEKAA